MKLAIAAGVIGVASIAIFVRKMAKVA